MQHILPLFSLYAMGIAYLIIMSGIDKRKHMKRMETELKLQQEKERHLERWKLFLKFMEECHEAKESMMEIMWMNKCTKEESIVDRINEKLLNL